MDSLHLSKINSGRLTLPKSIRNQLNLDGGSQIAFYLENDNIVIKKISPRKPLHTADSTGDMPGVGCQGEKKSTKVKIENKVTAIMEASGWKQS